MMLFLVIMVHTKENNQYGDHRAILDAAKVGIPTVGKFCQY